MLGVSQFPADRTANGVAEWNVEETATQLAARGHDVFVYVLSRSTPRDAGRFKGVRMIRLPVMGLFASLHALFQRPDVLHYHDGASSVWAFLPRLFSNGTRVVASIHVLPAAQKPRSWFLRARQVMGEWAQMHFPHVTLVGSPHLQSYCRALYGMDPVCLPEAMSASDTQMRGAEAPPGLPSGGYFLCAGPWSQNSGFDRVIEAYAQVKTAMPLVIAGRAGASQAFEEKLQKLANKDARVLLMADPGEGAMRALVQHCYAYVSPASVPGMSVRTLQAMFAGKVVLHPDRDGHNAHTLGRAITYASENAKALPEAIRFVLRDPELMERRGNHARNAAQQQYGWPATINRLEHLYQMTTDV